MADESADGPGAAGAGEPGVSISRVVAALPGPVAVIFRRLMQGPHLSSAEMRRRVAGYLVDLERLARDVDYIDVDLVRSVASCCHRLIDTLDGRAGEDHRRLVRAAVLYFLLDEDAEGDTSSLIGFDDDRLVVETVWAELERAAGR